MHASEFEWQKKNLEYEIGKSQSIINSVNASTEMPEERREVYLTYEQNRVNELSSQLVELNKNYWGSYYGHTSWGVTIGQ